MKQTLLLAFFFVLLFSCHKDKISNVPTSKGVYVINEGNFTFGNGEISFYDPNTNQVSNNLFYTANNYSLGDVVQSMYVKDSIGFIVVNNSQKVEVIKIPSFQKIRTITVPHSSPRYILPIDDSIAYVSELYSNNIHVINYLTGSLVKEIAVPQYTEHMVRLDEYVFVEGKKIYSNTSSKGALLRIRVADHTFMDGKEFSGDAGGIEKDKNNHVWIAVDEDPSSTKASLQCFDKNLNFISANSMVAFGFHPSHLQIDNNREKLFFLSGAFIYFSDVNSNIAPISMVSTTASNPYSMGMDPTNGDIYVSDALDYVQPSRIYRYDKNGQLLHSFTAGIISGNFAFGYE